ncbi:MAG: 4Fe-4S binding protein [Deltaproteobacteria bacterium]|nr:4Fe-4S binding protein [Deltaproteobacteria bacterium]
MNMMHEIVKEWLEQEKIDLFIGYKVVDGHPLPCFFTRENIDDVDNLVESKARYPLEKIAAKVYSTHPEMKIGILARDCNQRALNVLYVWNQLDPEKIETVGINCCPSPAREHADCSYLEREPSGPLKTLIGIENNLKPEQAEVYSQEERFKRWSYEFEKCIKCYGCRNICPVCFCKECSLEHSDLIKKGELPVEIPIFHLVRAVHMAGRCIDCGLCEDACPANIPLRLLYREVNQITARLFDYRAGTDSGQSPFSILGENVTLEPMSL